MKKQINALLILAFGLSTVAAPVLAMKPNRPGLNPEHLLTGFSAVLATLQWAWQSQVSDSDEDEPMPNGAHAFTLISQSGSHFSVQPHALATLVQLSPTIADLLADLDGVGMTSIPLDHVNDHALYLLTQMATGGDRQNLLAYVRNLYADELERLRQEAEFLNSRALKDLISRAVDKPFDTIPNENLLVIFRHAGPQGRTACWSVNKRFREFMDDVQRPVALSGLGWTDTLPLVASFPVGKHPMMPVFDGHMLYVSNWRDGTLSVIDTNANHVTATINVGSNPLTPVIEDRMLYVYNYGDRSVSVIDANTNQVVVTIEVDCIQQIVFHGGILYVAFNRHGNISVMDAITNKVLATIKLCVLPPPVAHGKMLYDSDVDKNTIRVIDTENGQIVRIVSAGGHSWQPVVYGEKLYVVNMATRTVSVYDLGGYLPGQC